ncbi:hypothetical protein Fmac_015659 [Flemingia macrophylla]|uniref:Pentatricopeptide repeat-containing protein n=1 Tax=Flemingia macrophylla TaxID=520843 RepID=A0ABD1MF96_9FABA
MEEEGLAANPRTFDALVVGACRAGKVEGAVVLVRRMVDDGVPILYSTHMCVVGALLKMGGSELAVRYVRSFVGMDERLDTELLGCLASKLVNLKMAKEALPLLKEMKQRDLPMGHKLKKFYDGRGGNENGENGGV